MAKRSAVRVGTSGYDYRHWRGVFYPNKLARRRWFAYYARHFDTVEVNNTFYHLPAEATFDNWKRRATPDFCYSLKFNRYGSHLKHLKDGAEIVTKFLNRAERLGARLGPILVQLPPSWQEDEQRLREFLHVATPYGFWAVEFRNRTWFKDSVWEILKETGAALCVHDLVPDHPWVVTADWVYLRFHGPGGDMSRGYAPQHLAAGAQRARNAVAQGVRVFAYFNNDGQGHAVQDAARFRRYLTGESGRSRESEDRGLFQLSSE